MKRLLPLLLMLTACADEDRLVVGSKPFTESEIVGEMAALLAESLGAQVNRKYHMGGMVCFESLKQGQMDLYAEYTGTGLVNILGEDAESDPEKVYHRVSKEFRSRWDLVWLPPLGFNNTYALVVRSGTPDMMDLASISDLTKRGKTLKCGFDLAFNDRPDGYPGLVKHYGTEFCDSVHQMDPGLMYKALAEGQVDVISGYATDGRIKSLTLRTLEDDKHFFPPYQAAFLAHPAAFVKVPGLRVKLEALSGLLSDEKMTDLNAAVDGDKRTTDEVARTFLIKEGLLSSGGEAASRTFWGFFFSKQGEITRLTLEHISLVTVAMVLGVLVGMPLGILLTRRRHLAPYVLGLTATLQTIPSVALLALLMLMPIIGGIGVTPAITALFLYSLMAIVENTFVGIVQVDASIIDAGRGMGMTDFQVLQMIELPQAMPVIIAGIRLSAVVCVATATIASYIGAGGLGDLIFRGVARANNSMVAWGAIPAIVLSLIVHRGLTLLERRLKATASPE